MANRPGKLCNLKSGKSIGSQTNFADTFNWLVSCIKNLKAGKGIKVAWPSSDTPEISLDGGEGGEDRHIDGYCRAFGVPDFIYYQRLYS